MNPKKLTELFPFWNVINTASSVWKWNNFLKHLLFCSLDVLRKGCFRGNQWKKVLKNQANSQPWYRLWLIHDNEKTYVLRSLWSFSFFLRFSNIWLHQLLVQDYCVHNQSTCQMLFMSFKMSWKFKWAISSLKLNF